MDLRLCYLAVLLVLISNFYSTDYVTCQYCSRRFNEKAAERHINFCKDQQKRLASKREPTAEEKARAAARQKVIFI